jgi:hypothetical protein
MAQMAEPAVAKAKMTWERFNRLLVKYPLPRPRIVHAV